MNLYLWAHCEENNTFLILIQKVVFSGGNYIILNSITIIHYT